MKRRRSVRNAKVTGSDVDRWPVRRQRNAVLLNNARREEKQLGPGETLTRALSATFIRTESVLKALRTIRILKYPSRRVRSCRSCESCRRRARRGTFRAGIRRHRSIEWRRDSWPRNAAGPTCLSVCRTPVGEKVDSWSVRFPGQVTRVPT